jgi:hypothetical protein
MKLLLVSLVTLLSAASVANCLNVALNCETATMRKSGVSYAPHSVSVTVKKDGAEYLVGLTCYGYDLEEGERARGPGFCAVPLLPVKRSISGHISSEPNCAKRVAHLVLKTIETFQSIPKITFRNFAFKSKFAN